MLTHVWYPMTVATKSREVKKLINKYLAPEEKDALPFMLHDFGYRGATGDEAAARGGAAHLINFVGTDTLVGMELALSEYAAAPESLAFSVPATEHSVMTALGRDGEFKVVQKLFKDYPTGILSIVIDSYDTYKFVSTLTTRFKDDIRLRDGKVVFRPDSKTKQHPRPGDQVKWILRHLDASYGTTLNSEGRRVLDPHVGVLWGDGIDIDGIEEILEIITQAGYSAANMVFGMGGGLLQKVNRDTQRCAFKSSAQKRDGEWHDVSKDPLDATKKSKAGRLRLAHYHDDTYKTLRIDEPSGDDTTFSEDVLETVFENGEITREYTFAEIRQNAE
jgi:nicotinamide phosphoribosyltransferase